MDVVKRLVIGQPAKFFNPFLIAGSRYLAERTDHRPGENKIGKKIIRWIAAGLSRRADRKSLRAGKAKGDSPASPRAFGEFGQDRLLPLAECCLGAPLATDQQKRTTIFRSRSQRVLKEGQESERLGTRRQISPHILPSNSVSPANRFLQSFFEAYL